MGSSHRAAPYVPARKYNGFVAGVGGPDSATFAIDGVNYTVFGDDALAVRRLLAGYIAHARRPAAD